MFRKEWWWRERAQSTRWLEGLRGARHFRVCCVALCLCVCASTEYPLLTTIHSSRISSLQQTPRFVCVCVCVRRRRSRNTSFATQYSRTVALCLCFPRKFPLSLSPYTACCFKASHVSATVGFFLPLVSPSKLCRRHRRRNLFHLLDSFPTGSHFQSPPHTHTYPWAHIQQETDFNNATNCSLVKCADCSRSTSQVLSRDQCVCGTLSSHSPAKSAIPIWLWLMKRNSC